MHICTRQEGISVKYYAWNIQTFTQNLRVHSVRCTRADSAYNTHSVIEPADKRMKRRRREKKKKKKKKKRRRRRRRRRNKKKKKSFKTFPLAPVPKTDRQYSCSLKAGKLSPITRLPFSCLNVSLARFEWKAGFPHWEKLWLFFGDTECMIKGSCRMTGRASLFSP